jgi:hypothetical protein
MMARMWEPRGARRESMRKKGIARGSRESAA